MQLVGGHAAAGQVPPAQLEPVCSAGSCLPRCHVHPNPPSQPNPSQEHAANRARYDAIRALLRLISWLGFTARAAAAQASAGLVAAMALASVLYSLPPVALLALDPDAFLRWAGLSVGACWSGSEHNKGTCELTERSSAWSEAHLSICFPLTCPLAFPLGPPAPSWRRHWVTAWNVGHAGMVLLFCPQLYQLLPAGAAAAAAGASLTGQAERAVTLGATLGHLLWLLWHSQALVMALNGAGPLTNPFRHFLQASGSSKGCTALPVACLACAQVRRPGVRVSASLLVLASADHLPPPRIPYPSYVQGQLMILMLYTRLNQLHCTRHPHMLAAVHAVHTRLVRPAAVLMGGGGGGGDSGGAVTAAPLAPQQLCATYLPALQLGLGLLLPCCLVYGQERALRR